MAEIRIEPKRRNTAWVWAVLAVVAVAAIGYFLMNRDILHMGA